MFDLPTDLPADIVPLSWLLGVWEGTGVIDYEADGAAFQGEFAHRVSFSHDGGDYVNYAASAWLLGDGEARTPLVAETGYWRLARPAAAVDAGPALLETVDTYGALGHSLEATARALFIHTNTVRYRLRRVSELTGWDPLVPRDAYVLRTAIAVGRLADCGSHDVGPDLIPDRHPWSDPSHTDL